MFKTIRAKEIGSKKKSLYIAETILDAIRKGVYKPGDKLPPERVIADQMGVSRSAVREALSALQIAGVVIIRAAEGTYISDVSSARGQLDDVISLLEESESPLELWEARREIETAAALLAAAKDERKANAQALQEILQQMEETITRFDYDAYLEANRAFHRTLIMPAENSILISIAEGLLAKTDQLLVKEPTKRYLQAYVKRSPDKHRAIYEAYLRGDAEALRESIRRHFDELEQFYLTDSV